MKIKALALIACSALAACAAGDSSGPPGPPPTGDDTVVRRIVKETFFDPYSIRDARISLPVWGSLNFRTGWITCFEGNGKNRLGAYTGLSRRGYMIRDGQLVTAAADVHVCRTAIFRPFSVAE